MIINKTTNDKLLLLELSRRPPQYIYHIIFKSYPHYNVWLHGGQYKHLHGHFISFTVQVIAIKKNIVDILAKKKY